VNIVKVSHVCTLVYGKALPEADRVDAGIPAYGANGVKTFSSRALYDKPSIIIGRKGSAGELNRVYEPFWALDVTYYVIEEKDLVLLDYLYFFLVSKNIPRLARGVKPGINRNDIYALDMKLPSLDEQAEIVQKLEICLERTERAIELATFQIRRLTDLKQGLINEQIPN
jgi:type I restriction enzyme, S subunit